MWIIAGGYWYWCYECGAIREAQRVNIGSDSHPVGPWIKPVGKGGENPSDKLKETLK